MTNIAHCHVLLQKLTMLGVVMLALPIVAQASVILSFDSSTLTASAGGMAEFTGILTNTGNTEVFLNGDAAFLLYPTITLDDSPFFANSPLSLMAGESYVGPFFDVLVDPTTSPGPYNGSYTVQGGTDSNAFDNLATQSFQVTVTATAIPEPSSLSFLTLAIVVFAIVWRKQAHLR